MVNTTERNALVVATFQELAPGRKAVAFAADVQHAEDLAGAFRWVGWASGAWVGVVGIEGGSFLLDLIPMKQISRRDLH